MQPLARRALAASSRVDTKLGGQAGRDPPAWTGGVVRVVPKMGLELPRTEKRPLKTFFTATRKTAVLPIGADQQWFER
jgi:hypothetical protein